MSVAAMPRSNDTAEPIATLEALYRAADRLDVTPGWAKRRAQQLEGLYRSSPSVCYNSPHD